MCPSKVVTWINQVEHVYTLEGSKFFILSFEMFLISNFVVCNHALADMRPGSLI